MHRFPMAGMAQVVQRAMGWPNCCTHDSQKAELGHASQIWHMLGGRKRCIHAGQTKCLSNMESILTRHV